MIRIPITLQNLTLMQAMLENNTAPSVVSAMLLLTGCRQEHASYMSGSIIGYRSVSLPQRIKTAIYQNRLDLIATEHNNDQVGELATAAEVAAYMYTYTLSYPPTQEIVRVYQWAMKEVTVKYLGWSEEQYWKAVALYVEQPLVPVPLSDYEQKQYLWPLSRWLRRQVVRDDQERRRREGRKLPQMVPLTGQPESRIEGGTPVDRGEKSDAGSEKPAAQILPLPGAVKELEQVEVAL